MRDHLRWGETFQAVMDEFSTEQMDALREHCRNLITEARAFDLAGYRAGAIAFDRDGYAFVLERAPARRWWSLEVADFPPPDGGGTGRIRAARRAREKRERKQKAVAARPQRARRPRRITEDTQELLIHLLREALRTEFGHKLLRASAAMDVIWHNVRGQCRDVISRARAALLKDVQYRTQGYVEKCREREKRIDTTREIASGMRLESRLVRIGRLQIQLNTWAPIDPGFDQIWDSSLFGVRLLESENL
jgi:hypothetical protein